MVSRLYGKTVVRPFTGVLLPEENSKPTEADGILNGNNVDSPGKYTTKEKSTPFE